MPARYRSASRVAPSLVVPATLAASARTAGSVPSSNCSARGRATAGSAAASARRLSTFSGVGSGRPIRAASRGATDGPPTAPSAFTTASRSGNDRPASYNWSASRPAAATTRCSSTARRAASRTARSGWTRLASTYPA